MVIYLLKLFNTNIYPSTKKKNKSVLNQIYFNNYNYKNIGGSNILLKS